MPLTRFKLTAIADDGITSAKILDGDIATADIADDAVTTAKIVDDAVTTAKIVDDAVTGAKIADGEVSVTKLSATGTKDETTFLRGDNTFQTVQTLSNIDGGNASSVYTVAAFQLDGGSA